MGDKIVNLDTLLDETGTNDNIQKIITHFQSGKKQIKLNALVGSQECFVAEALMERGLHKHLIILNDKEEAAYYYNTLSNIGKKKAIHFFPDSFKRPLLFEEVNLNNIVDRTEIVHKVVHQETFAVVTYPEALFEKVVDPIHLDKSKIEVQVGESLDVDTAIEVLIGFGFERSDYVYQPGDFSIRGGIVDIFSFGGSWPHRIELFDEEVESIRTFNPTTQLSIDHVQKLDIFPNVKSKFRQDQKKALPHLLPEDCIVWVKEGDGLVEKLQICFEKAENYAGSLEGVGDVDMKSIFDDRTFIYPAEVVHSLSSFRVILQKSSEFFKKEEVQLDFQSLPQPHFNRNFSLLIENLKDNEAKGIRNFLFTDNTKQIERFYAIFKDLNAKVEFQPILTAIHAGFVDLQQKVACYTDHQIFERFHRYKLREGFSKDQAISLKMLRELEVGDFVVHIDHGIGRYSGLEKININGVVQESVRLIYLNNDILYVSINSLHKISRFVGKEGTPPALSKIGGEAWKNLKRKTKAKVKDIAKELIKLYAQRKATEGFQFSEDGYLQNELEASFIYEDTPDQSKATTDVKEDMMKPYPMDRLICGDVGFGKTEVAIRAAFKAITNGKQVAVLVPTTILALQHYQTFSKRLAEFSIKCDYLNRFRSAKQKTEIFKKLETGEIELIIGTHAMLNKSVKFKDLGLLIIDEEQKFGVAAKEKLRSIKVNVDTLTLTATPIPRTLQFSLMAARDLSIIRTPPPNRQPIHTERRIFSEGVIKEAIYYEVNRGGQVFFVHNRVKTLREVAEMVKRLCPDVKVSVAHGQMESDDLEKTLVSFIDGEYDVLVCTNIIETGLDIANANTIIINNAHQFGMSDLHQLRGRVGRSNQKAFCYLFSPPLSVLTEDARKRLKTLEEFSELGSGFQIAMKDLDIRGAGNLLGGEQSGFISDIGYETYQKILEEAVVELKENEYQDLFKEELDKKQNYVRDVEIDTDVEMMIPDAYVSNIKERFSLYNELDRIETKEDIDKFREALKDRFGPIPETVESLFDGLELRWICKSLGFERLTLKENRLRGYFISNPQSRFFETRIFQNMMAYISKEGARQGYRLKQGNNFLIVIKENVRSLRHAREHLEKLLQISTMQTEKV